MKFTWKAFGTLASVNIKAVIAKTFAKQKKLTVSVQNSPIQNSPIQNSPEKYENEQKNSPIQNSP